jgi:Tol biopolymer transport system component
MGDAVNRLTAALADRYRLERELGAGGMATVYLAHDLRHDRRVAIKVLRPELAAVVGAERFLAEIRTTANLQHPHILPLFDSGQADSFLFYVMPYVEGESLRERLDRERQLPVDEAVRIATDLAEALDYAHRKRVIHRDIKPANVLLLDGKPVIADFGIALAVGAAGGGRLTETGLSLGTPHYMSPEQATGEQHVGPATDIYALGCVLYEMLVGEPPYTGATPQAVLGKIIAGAPEPVTSHRKTVPPNVNGAIRKALEKVPADRFAHAADLAKALADPTFRSGGEAVEISRKRRWHVPAAVTLVLGLTLGIAFGTVFARSGPTTVTRLAIPLPDDQAYSGVGNAGVNLTWTPDGTGVVYAASAEGDSAQLWYRPLGVLEARSIPGTRGARNPNVSPDGSSVAFAVRSAANALRIVPLAGGEPVTVASGNVGGFDWGPDGSLYFAQGGGGLNRVAASGGSPQALSTPEEAIGHWWPDVLPDGNGILFTIVRNGNDPQQSSIAVTTGSGGQYKELFPGVLARYARSGHIVYTTADGTLMAVSFDLRRRETTGTPTALLGGVQVDPSSSSHFAISEGGALLYRLAEGGRSHLVRVARDGSAEVIDPDWAADIQSAILSPDGRRVAVSLGPNTGRTDVWIKDLDRGPLSRLTSDGRSIGGHWAPDGKSLVFASSRNGFQELFSIGADGSTPPSSFLRFEARSIWEGTWAPDGEEFLYRTSVPGRCPTPGTCSNDIMVVRPGSEDAPRIIAATPSNEAIGPVSPDGRWVAYVSDETGQDEVYVRPFSGGGSRSLVSTEGGVQPRWSRDGRELFFLTVRGELAVVAVARSPQFQSSQPRVLFSAAEYLGGRGTTYDVTPDGEHFIMVRPIPTPSKLIVVQNFIQELRERVPR